jgi:hypothetical protein
LIGIGIFGFISSIFLFKDLNKKKTCGVLWWLCMQCLQIVHQIVFTIELILITINQSLWRVVLVTSISLVYVVIEIYFFIFIINIYEKFVEEETTTNELERPKNITIPSASELLADTTLMGLSTPIIETLESLESAGPVFKN